MLIFLTEIVYSKNLLQCQVSSTPTFALQPCSTICASSATSHPSSAREPERPPDRAPSARVPLRPSAGPVTHERTHVRAPAARQATRTRSPAPGHPPSTRELLRPPDHAPSTRALQRQRAGPAAHARAHARAPAWPSELAHPRLATRHPLPSPRARLTAHRRHVCRYARRSAPSARAPQ
jgi:hypothetical protein